MSLNTHKFSFSIFFISSILLLNHFIVIKRRDYKIYCVLFILDEKIFSRFVICKKRIPSHFLHAFANPKFGTVGGMVLNGNSWFAIRIIVSIVDDDYLVLEGFTDEQKMFTIRLTIRVECEFNIIRAS